MDATRASSDMGLAPVPPEQPLMVDDGDEKQAGFMDDEEGGEDDEEGRSEDEEWLVLDAMGNMDGLERLVVIAVGLDAAIGAQHTEDVPDDKPDEMETRSRLYRACTRAHLMVVVVNAVVKGGWLEFLGHVRLRDEGTRTYEDTHTHTRTPTRTHPQPLTATRSSSARKPRRPTPPCLPTSRPRSGQSPAKHPYPPRPSRP